LESNFNHLKSIQAMPRTKRAGSTSRILAPRNLPSLGSVLALETDFPVAENEGDIDLIEDADNELHARNGHLASVQSPISRRRAINCFLRGCFLDDGRFFLYFFLIFEQKIKKLQ